MTTSATCFRVLTEEEKRQLNERLYKAGLTLSGGSISKDPHTGIFTLNLGIVGFSCRTISNYNQKTVVEAVKELFSMKTDRVNMNGIKIEIF